MSATEVLVADAKSSVGVLRFKVEEKEVIAKALVESKGIKLIKPELKCAKPVVIIQSNSKFKIQLSKPNVDPKADSKAVVEEALKNAPRDESEGAGINFQEVSNRGSGAMCAGLLLALVTFEGEKQKGPLGDFKLISDQAAGFPKCALHITHFALLFDKFCIDHKS